jgi:hypothetical protein
VIPGDEESLEEKAQRMKIAKVNSQALETLLTIGSMMSNLCFNLGHTNTADARAFENMRELWPQWDDARKILAVSRTIGHNGSKENHRLKNANTKKPAAGKQAKQAKAAGGKTATTKNAAKPSASKGATTKKPATKKRAAK